MNFNVTVLTAATMLAISIPSVTLAEEEDSYEQRRELSNMIKTMRKVRKKLPMPVPAGLFGIYAFPEKGQGVAGVNFQHYEFSGLIQGTDSVSAQTAVTTTPNRFFGNPGQPPTLRVVPTKAKADVIFPFANFSLNETVALVALAPLIRKQTTLETFAGGGGTTSLGTNTVKSEGLGDIKFGAIFRAFNGENNKHNLVIDAVLSAPTGSITQEDMQLTPANTKVKARLAYGMQLGSGTWDTLVGASYWGKDKQWGWGAQYLATIPLESKNSEGWRYGDKHEVTSWISYEWDPTLVTSARVRGETQGTIKGIDPKIYGPGLGADPENYGGDKVEFAIGVNWMVATANNISIEFSKPIYQDRNGIQADHDYSLFFSWRSGFF
jgi:hypothetical protein